MTWNNSLAFSDAHLPYEENKRDRAPAALRCFPDLKSKMLTGRSDFKTVQYQHIQARKKKKKNKNPESIKEKKKADHYNCTT